jgi:hypothetical protein
MKQSQQWVKKRVTVKYTVSSKTSRNGYWLCVVINKKKFIMRRVDSFLFERTFHGA